MRPLTGKRAAIIEARNAFRRERGYDPSNRELSKLMGGISLGTISYAINRAKALKVLEPPIPMVLHCPECRARHIDVGEFATKPHHTHACQGCGFVWRPAIVPTVGVQFLPGFKNEDPAPSQERIDR